MTFLISKIYLYVFLVFHFFSLFPLICGGKVSNYSSWPWIRHHQVADNGLNSWLFFLLLLRARITYGCHHQVSFRGFSNLITYMYCMCFHIYFLKPLWPVFQDLFLKILRVLALIPVEIQLSFEWFIQRFSVRIDHL